MGSSDSDPTQEFDVGAEEDSSDLEFYGGRLMSAFPILFFIVWAIIQTALWRVSDTNGLTIGILFGIIIGMFFVKGSWTGYANTLFDGMTQPVAVTAVVAWLWAGMFAQTLQAGGFVQGLVWLADIAGVGAILFPAITFVLAALLATGIGTGYGTVIAFVVLFWPTGIILGADPVLLFGAILSGAVFGDNLAPVSDTTIVSAVTQDSDIGGVVATRFKYAIVAAAIAFPAYVLASSLIPGLEITGDARAIFLQNADPAGLIHLVSMGIVIGAAVNGRHIVEAITWGIIAAIVSNLLFGLATVSDILIFRAPAEGPLVEPLAFLPFLEVVEPANVGVGGSLVDGITGFFGLVILILFIIAAAQIMISGGAFDTILEFSFSRLATNTRNAELTMVGSAALINAAITINTAAEIAIGPYISKLGEQFNINGYRRANILDAMTAALGYIFPWSGGVLVGFQAMQGLPAEYEFIEAGMVVNPVQVFPYVFHGWLLVAVFVISAYTGFGREYLIDRESKEVARA